MPFNKGYKTKELPIWTTLLLFLRNYEFSIQNSKFIILNSQLPDYSSTAACAAAKRAIGTRNGEQDA